MNLSLISKDKNGELQVSFFWISFLILLIGFLFGLGFSFAYFIINYVLGNDGYYIYHFIKEYKIAILLGLIVLFVVKFNKEMKK